MQFDAFGDGGDQLGQTVQLLALDARVDRIGSGADQILGPIDGEFVRLALGQFGGVLARIQLVAVAVHQRLGLVGAQHAVAFQLGGIQLAGGLVLADGLVHHRLGRCRFVGFVMAPTAVADQVDDHVFLELLAEFVSQFGHEDHRVRVVAVHVEDRRADHLGHVRAVQRGTRVVAGAGGEADLVVYDDVHRAADRETARLRHLEQLHHHALAGECRIAMDQDRQHGLAFGIAETFLTRAHTSHHDRVDDFQVRGVERQRQMHLLVGANGDIGRETHVVLDVAGMRAVVMGVLELAFEFVEQLARVLAQRIDQHIEAAAVGHADHDVLDLIVAGLANDLVHHRNQRIAAFQREALLADVLGVQVALQGLRRR